MFLIWLFMCDYRDGDTVTIRVSADGTALDIKDNHSPDTMSSTTSSAAPVESSLDTSDKS